jgi:hypothetical protein
MFTLVLFIVLLLGYTGYQAYKDVIRGDEIDFTDSEILVVTSIIALIIINIHEAHGVLAGQL